MPSLPGLTEKIFTGRDYGKDLSQLRGQFGALGVSGRATTDEGIGDLRRISGDFRDLINKGGLTDAVSKGYDVAQGRISDDVVRAGQSFRSTLLQQAANNGGQLSPAAIAALSKQNEVDVNQRAFNARNELSMDEAHVAQAATQKLQSQILEIADMIRTTGLTREQLAQAGQLAISSLQFNRNKAIDSSMRGWMSMFTGGAGGGG